MDIDSSTPDTRSAALAMVADGNSVASVASVYGVSVETVRQWMHEPPAAQPDVVHKAPRPARVADSAAPACGHLDWLMRITIVSVLIGCILWMIVPVIIDDFHGSPPIDQLRRSEGWVKTYRECYPLPRNVTQEDVTLVGAHSTVTWTLPCVLPPGALSDGKVHRMTVLSSSRRRIGTIVDEVTLDGRTLLAYERQPAGPPWVEIGILACFMAALLPVLVATVRTYPRRPRQA